MTDKTRRRALAFARFLHPSANSPEGERAAAADRLIAILAAAQEETPERVETQWTGPTSRDQGGAPPPPERNSYQERAHRSRTDPRGGRRSGTSGNPSTYPQGLTDALRAAGVPVTGDLRRTVRTLRSRGLAWTVMVEAAEITAGRTVQDPTRYWAAICWRRLREAS